jgi:hypothetical protein
MELPTLLYWLVPVSCAAALVLFVAWRLYRNMSVLVSLEQARALFEQQRPQLEKLFFQVASASGKPRGLRWKECQWENLIEWVRDKETGQLLALVGITIAFEAIEGSDMEDLPAVGNLRNASAVFLFQDAEWQTSGRVIFNLNPAEAVEHFRSGYERIE